MLLPAPGAPDVLYLLDLSSWARAIYEGSRMHGVDVDAPESNVVVLGVLKRFVQVLVKSSPAFFGVAMDAPGEQSWRHTIWPGYKAGRAPSGPGYVRQLALLEEIFLAHRIPIFAASGWEADDFLGAITKRARRSGLRVVLLSRDHDLWQLFETACPGGVVAWDVGREAVYSAKSVRERYGVPPELLAEHMALAGDGDEAPGIRGIGQKRAAEILARHGSLEQALEQWSWWEPKKIALLLRDGADAARMSLKLVRLGQDAGVPLSCSLWNLVLGWSAEDVDRIRRLGVKHGLPILGDADVLFPVDVRDAMWQAWKASDVGSMPEET